MKKTRSFLYACCCTLVLAWSGSVQAQSYYELEGVVYGASSTPLRGIAVFLEDITHTRVGQTITDADGRYHFSQVGAGLYFVVVKPNDNELQSAVQRVELINTARVGSNSSVERVDITLVALPRRSDGVSGTFFVQDVPRAAEAEYGRAMENIAKKNHSQAVLQLRQALRIFPNYFMASQQLGLLHVEAEQYQDAVGPLVKAIEINPNAGPSYLALGIASLRLGRADLALDALERARRVDQKSFRVHFFMGLALIELNRPDEAEKALKESYKLGASKATSARLYLASIYSKRGQNREAVNELEGYLRDNPKAANTASIRDALNKLKNKL